MQLHRPCQEPPIDTSTRPRVTLEASAAELAVMHHRGVALDDAGVSALATLPLEDLPRRTLAGANAGNLGPRPRFHTGDAAGQGSLPELHLEGVLGEGGMGVVHLAQQRSMGREVAVKRVRLDGDGDDARREQRLIAEALLTGALEHPNIVPVYELGQDEHGHTLMVMRRIEGRPWRALLEDRPAADGPGHGDWLERQLRVLLTVCDALRLAHARGVIHRDLKPDNVMIGAFGEVLVVDWGVAVSLRPADASRFPLARDSRHIAGTPAYMAPEQVKGDGGGLGVWTDVYLVGATLFEVLTGRAPHDADRVHASLFSAWESRPPELPPQVPAPLAAICVRAMAREPADRYGDVAALHAALDDFLRHRASIEITERALAESRALHATLPRAPEEEVDAGKHAFDPAGVHRRFAACRFGFQQALDIWPGNLRARDGLQAVLRLMIERSLAGGLMLQAALLLEELPLPDAALSERVAQARQQESLRERQLHHLGAIGQRHDLLVGLTNRRRYSIGLVVVWGGIAAGEHLAYRKGALTPTLHALVPLILLGLTLAYGVVRWQAIRNAGVNHRLYHVASMTLGAVLMARLLGIIVAAPLPLQMVYENTLFFLGLGATTAMTRRRLAPAALVYVAAALVAATAPDWAFAAAALAHVVGIGAVSLGWRESSLRPRGSAA